MTMSRSFQGIWIPKEIWLNQDVSMQAKCLWAELHSLYSPEHKGCYASNDYLAEFMGLKVRRIQELLKELKEADLLEQSSFDGRCRVLRALVPEHSYEQECTADMQNNAPQGCRKVHVSGAESCAPSYIENKEEIIDKNIAQSRTSCGHEQRSDMQFSSSSGKFEGITQSDLDEWKASYPEIDIPREISKAQQWLLSNPSKARKKLWRKFLTGWFTRANDKAENQKAYRSQSGASKVDRRTLDKQGNPVESPADGLF